MSKHYWYQYYFIEKASKSHIKYYIKYYIDTTNCITVAIRKVNLAGGGGEQKRTWEKNIETEFFLKQFGYMLFEILYSKCIQNTVEKSAFKN